MQIKKLTLKRIIKEESFPTPKHPVIHQMAYRTSPGPEERVNWEYEQLKKEFIKKAIYGRSRQIKKIVDDRLVKGKKTPTKALDTAMWPPTLVSRDLQGFVDDIATYVEDTDLEINDVARTGTDPHYGGPAHYKMKLNTIVLEEFASFWVKQFDSPKHGAWLNKDRKFIAMIFHELGHAKENAINRVFNMYTKGQGSSPLKLEDWDNSYYKQIYSRIKKCFPGLKNPSLMEPRKPGTHSEKPWEHGASVEELRMMLGRLPNELDIMVVCEYKKRKRVEKRAWAYWNKHIVPLQDADGTYTGPQRRMDAYHKLSLASADYGADKGDKLQLLWEKEYKASGGKLAPNGAYWALLHNEI
jgi:hypothetical protein